MNGTSGSSAPVRTLLIVVAVLVGIPLRATAQQSSISQTSASQGSASQSGASQTSASQSGAPQPGTRPPVPNRLNEVLPPWLRVRGEFRERVERIDDAGFTAGRDDGYFLSRLRLNATVTSPLVSGTVQVQDSRVGGKTVGSTGAPFTATFDVRQAYADVGRISGRTGRGVTARVGRQELNLGDTRLVGNSNWTNAARTFDAVRVTASSKALQLDIFAASIVRILDGSFDKSGNGNRLAGTYASTPRVVPNATLDAYMFYRQDRGVRPELGAPGTLSQVTTGTRVAGRLPARVDYNVEMAVQSGSLTTDVVRAWAGHWQLRHTLRGRVAPHLIAEYNYASGDADGTDGVRGTFDPLYASGHDKYGLADQVGWRNIRHVRVGVDATLLPATPVSVNWHHYQLANAADALYAASGAVVARMPGGAAGGSVGQEFDAQVVRPLTPQLTLAAGYAHLLPGTFLKAATPGKSYTTSFVMLTYAFLAEK